MTSQPQAPGATAVYLYREQTTDDRLRMFSFYVRLKVLTEGGKDFANVELPFATGREGLTIDSISGRTIHPDGTIIPFTGKPYEKLTVKMQGYQEKAKVFTLPAVEVGSILEYRYRMHYDDAYFQSPDWYVQYDLFTRKAHYLWRPTTQTVASSKGDILDRIAYTQFLPAGASVQIKHPAIGNAQEITLDVVDIPALPREAYMPPINSFSYRVLFYYTQYVSGGEFWVKSGKEWSKSNDRFIGPGAEVKAFVAKTVNPSDSDETKARKLYQAVMTFENTNYTREHSTTEDRSQGFKQINNTDDVLARKRGSDDQLADLYIAMARAAGLKAYLLAVANRSRRAFLPDYLSLSQLDDHLAIVVFDGKDHVLDPGKRYCRFGQVAWQHTLTGGLRQTDSGTNLVGLPVGTASQDHLTRIADLKLDEHGEATGTVTLTMEGNAALHWRQEALRGDDASLNLDLKSNMEGSLPGGMEVRVTDVKNLTDPDKPLVVAYAVKGAIGSPTGKRLLINGQLFQSNAKPIFTAAKRELSVVMDHPKFVQDAVRLVYADGMTIESLPSPETDKLASAALYSTSVKRGANSVVLYRNMELAKPNFEPTEYSELKSFYGKVETKDQEPVVLMHAPSVSPAATALGSAGSGR